MYVGEEQKQKILKALEIDVKVLTLEFLQYTVILHCSVCESYIYFYMEFYHILQLLQKLHLMDYSLLIGINDCKLSAEAGDDSDSESIEGLDKNGYVSSDDGLGNMYIHHSLYSKNLWQ